MKNASRFAAVLALLTAATACDTPEAAPIALPAGLAIADLDDDHRRLLRATLAIDGGLLDETTVVLDPDAETIRADVVLGNVGSGGARTATLRVYGRDTADSDEVLLGVTTDDVTITPAEAVYVDFDGSTFDICGVGVDGACGLALDRNRNGRPNIEDLIDGVDPGPSAPFLLVSPSTLQFSSGIRLGDFGRQVIVTENLGDHPVRIDLVQVAGGQGMGVALFNPDAGSTDTPRRRIELAQLDSDDDGVGDVVLAPGEELFVAVSFAPVNSFLTTAAVQIVATDVVTGVSQGSRTKVIANSDGALRPRDPLYVEPVGIVDVDVGAGSIVAAPFPAAELFSGAEITAPAGSTGLTHSGSSLVVRDGAGETLSMPADAAFVVDVAAGQRFTAALASAGDIDIALLELSDAGVISVLSTSRQQGESAEAVELFNGGEAARRLVVVLGRIDLSAPVAVAGALVADDQPLPFRLSCQLTKGPELDDVTPISPVRGPLEGGTTVTLRGRGFYMPATSAGPHARVSFNGVASISTPQVTKDEAGNQTIVVVLPPGGAAADVPVTVVIENPASGGGDGQAATLPEGFRYDLPRARVTRISPDVTTTTGGSIDVLITGAFFFNTHGAPRVTFGDTPVEGLVVDSATILVRPPAHAAGDVGVTVENALVDGSFGDPSEPVDFRFVQPTADPPTLTSISSATGSALGGDRFDVVGTGFVVGTRVLLGNNDAEITSVTATQLSVVTRPVSAAGSVDVVVVNPDGQVAVLRAAYTFTLPAPAIVAVIPERASTGGNAIVVVNGEGFRDDTVVFFENADGTVSTAARAVSRSSSTTLLVTTPSFAAGTGRIVVENVDGQRASSSFSFLAPQGAPPTIVSISPSSGAVTGGTLVSITAAATQTPSVVFGGVAIAAADVVSEPAGAGRVTLKVRSPAGSIGTTAITVINADGQSASTTFTYLDQRVARIVGVRPAFVHAGLAGDELLVFGEHFSSLGAALSANAIHGNPAQRTPLSVLFHSDGFASIAVDIALPAGAFIVELVGENGAVSSATLSARVPDITLVSTDDSRLVIIGTDLGGALLSSVRVNGAECVITTADERSISCTLITEPEDGEPVFELGYGEDVVNDAAFEFVEDGGGDNGDGCQQNSCNGQGCEADVNGDAVCFCDLGFDPVTGCQPCQPGSNSPTCPPQQAPRSCSDVREASFGGAPSGEYLLDVDGEGGPLLSRLVQCDMDFDGGGWTRVGATVSNGQLPPSVAFVFSVEEIMAIASISSQVHVRTATSAVAPTVERFVTSRPGTTAIQNLRLGNSMNMSQENKPTDYVGSMVANLLVTGCTPVAVWPAVYHACGNVGGLHFFLDESPSSRWDNFEGSPHEAMEVYVRAAPVPQSCEELREREPGVASGEYFVGGTYQLCNFDEQPFVDAVVVTAAGESTAGDGLCSLREAVKAIGDGAANGSGCLEPGTTTTIKFDVDSAITGGMVVVERPILFDGGNRTVNLVNGGLRIGQGASGSEIRSLRFTGSTNTGVIGVLGNVTLRDLNLDGVTIQDVPAVDQAVSTIVDIHDSTFKSLLGGQPALRTRGATNVFGSRFTNIKGSTGGAIFVDTGAFLDVEGALFAGNGGDFTSGGAINVEGGGTARVSRSAFLDNRGGSGGGALASKGNLDITQCTLRGNSAVLQVGGGIVVNGGTTRVSSSTIAFNIGSTSAGVRVENGALIVKDSILARNKNVTGASGFVDCSVGGPATATFLGTNVFGFGNCNTSGAPTLDDAGLPAAVANANNASQAVLRPAEGFVGNSLDVGNCTDIDGIPLGPDQGGGLRESFCTLGAVEIERGEEREIVVDTLQDFSSPSTCSLRDAVQAAATNAPINGCDGGGVSDRIVFEAAGVLALTGGPIELAVPGLVIDGIVGHDGDVVAITADSRVFNVRAATTVLGLQLGNTAFGAAEGGVVNVVGASFRGEDLFFNAGSSDEGGGISAVNAVVTLRGSTIAVNGAGVGEAIFLDDSAAVIERSTLVGATGNSLIDGRNAAQLVMRRVSVRGAESNTTPLINIAVAQIDDSVIDAPGRTTLCSGFPRTNGGVASNGSCNIVTVTSGALSRGLGSNGGRTPTIRVDAGLPPFTICPPGSIDQRGRSTDGICTAGALSPIGSEPSFCGDGFVDESEGTVLASLFTDNLAVFSGDAVIGSGTRTGSGPSLVVADSAGGEFVFCGRFGCSQPTEISPGPIAAIGLADTSAETGTEITVIDVDGRVRAFADTGSGVPVLTASLDATVVTVTDVIFFADFFGGGFDFIATGVDTDDVGFVHYYNNTGSSFELVASFAAGGTPQRGLVVRRRTDGGVEVLVPVLIGTSITHRKVFVTNSFTPTPNIAFDLNSAPGTSLQPAPTTATLMLGRNGVIWGAQNQFNSIKVGRAGQESNVTANIAATSLTAGDIDGDGNDELVAIDDGGFVTVLQEINNNVWQLYDGLGFTDAPTGNTGARCQLLDVGESPRPELICALGNQVQVLELAPTPDEQCDINDPFGPTACNQCLIGGGP